MRHFTIVAKEEHLSTMTSLQKGYIMTNHAQEELVKNIKLHRGSHSTSTSTASTTAKKHNIYKQYAFVPKDGKLPGGHPVCGDLSYPICSWNENDTSSTEIFRSALSESSSPYSTSSSPLPIYDSTSLTSFSYHHTYISNTSSLLDTLDILNKLAYWFLFPIANDEQQLILYNEENIFDKNSLWSSILLPMVNRLVQRFKAHSSDRTRTIMTSSVNDHSVATTKRERDDPSQADPICLSAISSNASISCAYDVMFSSISTIDSEEMKREMEINTMALLPVITYGEDQVNEREGPIHDHSVPPTSESYDSFERLPSLPSSPQRSSYNNIEGLQWSWIAVPKDPIKSETMDVSRATTTQDDFSQLSTIQDRHAALPMDQCVICQETFQAGQQLQVLPCNHRFHLSCNDKCSSTASIDGVLNNGLCPYCKINPVLDDDDSMETIESLNLNGEVPSWAFARLGGFLAKEDFK
jgi:hypothetical protein